MSTKDTGGQAFPCYERGSAGAGPLDLTDPGMTLRDYFAAKAMQGLMGRNWCDPTTGKAPDDIFEVWSLSAYKAADAMLKARQA